MDEIQNTETNDDLKLRFKLLELTTTERKVSDERYAPRIIEKIVFGTIILFALAALYFIFIKVGLPVPSSL
jgi:hypothetical protein